MAEPSIVDKDPPSLPPPESLKANGLLQQAMLTLVEHCHRPGYQTTLDLALQARDKVLSAYAAPAGFTAVNGNILRLVLRDCYNVDRGKTLVSMRAAFERINTGLLADGRAQQDGR